MPRLLWRFHSEHIREGPFDGMPLLLHATPIPTNANHFDYIVHLTTATQVNIIALVQAYCRRSNIRILSQPEILDLDSFTYPSTIGGNPKELRRPPGATNVRGIQPDVIEDIMEQVQSEELRDILDLKWTTVINVAQIRDIATRGRGSDGVPKFLKKANHKHTWADIKFNREPVNCAAFALCNFVSNRGKYQERLDFSVKGRKCRERSRKFQDIFGWGDSVNLAQIEDFVKVFKDYQVTVFMPNKRSPEASFFKVYTGEGFTDPLNSMDLVNYEDHWAWCSSIQGFVDQMKHGGSFAFCRDCLKVIKNPEQLNVSELPCHISEPPKKRIKAPKACRAPQCEGHFHEKGDKCPFTECPACNTLNNNNSHRCCLLPRSFGEPKPHEKYWDNEKGDYTFCVDEEGDGKTPAFFSYDMETMIKTTIIKPLDPKNLIRPEHNENFGFDIKDFDEMAKMYLENLNVDDPEVLSSLGMSSEYNQMIPNLIVCTNIYSSQIPKNPGDPPFNPKMYRFEGPDCVQEFIEFAVSYNKGYNYFCAHNGSGFDSKFIYQTGLDMDIKLNQIMRGSNFIKLTLKGSKTLNCKKTTFIDNMLHLPGSLAGLAKDFFGKSSDENLRTSMSKGYFPHGFNRVENQNYVGPLPDLEHFTPETMKLGSGESRFDAVIKIQKWHREYRGEWDFKKEINKYCDLDVLILAALMKEYMAISIPKGAIPLMYTTAPAYVHELILLRATEHLVYYEMDIQKLKSELKASGTKPGDLKEMSYSLRNSNTAKHLHQMEEEAARGWAVLKPPEYNMVRLSLRGGRTEIRSSQMTLSTEEEARGIKIMYQDVTSLYPAMQLTKKFCIGVPEINVYDYEYRPCYSCRNSGDSYNVKCLCEKKGYTGVSLDIKEHYDSQPTAKEILDDESFFGYVCVSLIPPTDLYHPVVQIKKTTYKENGKVDNIKCQNNLVIDDHKELYLDTPTLKKCLTSGYKLEKLFRFDKYKSGIGGWVPAGIEFYVDKERTSGPPPSLTEKGSWVAEYVKECPDMPEPSCDREAYIALNEHIVPGLGKKLAISLEKDIWSKQPAKRKVFKIFNNCGWGKHAQRPIMPTTHTLDSCNEVSAIENIFQNISNGTSVLGGVQVYNQGKKLMFTITDAKRDPQLHTTYLAAGAMVPAYGRLCLLEGLEIAGERVAMCDTDSIIYKTVVGEGNIPISSLLGKFKEEEVSEDGIIEFVGFGPKCYSIKTRKNVDIRYPDGSVKKEPLTFTKLKGISQTVETQGVDHDFMYDTMTEYLKTGKVGSVKVPQWGIRTNMCLNGAPCIYTQNYLKDFKLMSDDSIKGYRINSGVKIYPFGFVPK